MSQFTSDMDGQFDETEISGLNRVQRTSTIKKACKVKTAHKLKI